MPAATRAPGETRDLVLAAIREDPGATLSDVGRTLGLDQSTVERHVHALERLRRVESRRDGRVRRLFPFGKAVAPLFLSKAP